MKLIHNVSIIAPAVARILAQLGYTMFRTKVMPALRRSSYRFMAVGCVL